MKYTIAFVAAVLVACSAADPKSECSSQSDEISFYPDPTDCTKFYECHQGKEYSLSCPAGLYWNDELNVCDFKENAKCNQDATCADLPDGTYLPNLHDCQKFYECHDGKTIDIACPAGLLWNQPIVACDFPENVSCNAE